MAERLTKKINKTIQDKYSLGSYLYYDFNGAENTNRLLNKLGKLEDILEKYGIESVEELDKKIGHYIDKIELEAENDYLKKTIEKQNVVTQSISKDRDTWQKACELACEREDDCYVYDNIHRAYEFYQQAKQFAGR